MNPLEAQMIRDTCLEFLFRFAPAVLEDDELAEGFCYLVLSEVRSALQRQWEYLRHEHAFPN